MGQWAEAAVRWKATLLQNKKWVGFALAVVAVLVLVSAGPPLRKHASQQFPSSVDCMFIDARVCLTSLSSKRGPDEVLLGQLPLSAAG